MFIPESRVLTSFNAKNHHQKVDSCEDAMYWFFLSMYKFLAFMVFSHWILLLNEIDWKKPFTLTNFLFDLDTARPKWLPGRQVNLTFLYFTIIKVRKKINVKFTCRFLMLDSNCMYGINENYYQMEPHDDRVVQSLLMEYLNL